MFNKLTYKQKRILLFSQLENDFGLSGDQLYNLKNVIPADPFEIERMDHVLLPEGVKVSFNLNEYKEKIRISLRHNRDAYCVGIVNNSIINEYQFRYKNGLDFIINKYKRNCLVYFYIERFLGPSRGYYDIEEFLLAIPNQYSSWFLKRIDLFEVI